MSAIEKLWVEIGDAADIPLRGARVVRRRDGDIAIFRAEDGTLFALEDRCPHRGGPLSQGIVHGHAVTCPLHNWVISLESGAVTGPDQGCAKRFALRIEGGRVYLMAAAVAPQPA